jgi:hypothetical protein
MKNEYCLTATTQRREGAEKVGAHFVTPTFFIASKRKIHGSAGESRSQRETVDMRIPAKTENAAED